MVFDGQIGFFCRGHGDAVLSQLIFPDFDGVAVFVGEFDFDAVMVRLVAFGVGHRGRILNDFNTGDVCLVEGGAGGAGLKVGLFRDGLFPRFFHVPACGFVAVVGFRGREFVLSQFAVFKDGVGFAVKGVVFHAGCITRYADFEDAIGKFGSRGDFLPVGDELSGVDGFVYDCCGFFRDGRVVAVGFGGRCIDDVDGRCGDFFPFAAFFNEGGDDLFFVFVAQGQATFGFVGIGHFEGYDVVVISVDFFPVIIFRRDIGVVRFSRIVFVFRDVGNDVFVAVFASVFCRIFSRRNVCVICRHVGRPAFKYPIIIRSGCLGSCRNRL